MRPSGPWSPEEIATLAEVEFFRAKARVTNKLRRTLEQIHQALVQDIDSTALLLPPEFDPTNCQFVKGEHLEDFPYQYVDHPKHFSGDDKFTFRSLCWWGHHWVFAMILEGRHLRQYKKNLVEQFHAVAGRGLEISLAPTLWEWKAGEGYTLRLTHDRKAQVGAVIAERSFLKLVHFVRFDDPAVASGALPERAVATFRALTPILAR